MTGRNRSKYAPQPDGWPSLEKPETCTEEFLEGCWRRSLKRDPVVDHYDDFPSIPLNLNELNTALQALAPLDPAFQDALLVLRAYELGGGGLKRTLQERKRRFGVRPALAAAFPRMTSWLPKLRNSRNRAAMFAVAQLGVPGQSFAEVVEELRKAYPKYEGAVANGAPAPRQNYGDTGRKLHVRMRGAWLGRGNEPVREIRGIPFAEDGTAFVPDDWWWRTWTRQGVFEFLGVVNADSVGKKLEKETQAQPLA